MSDDISAPAHDPVTMHLRAEAHRSVRKQRILYTILGIYVVLTRMWFAGDTTDGTENLWFYWPMLGTGVIVAITSVCSRPSRVCMGSVAARTGSGGGSTGPRPRLG